METISGRRLEIGPHKERIPGFETLDIVKSPLVDHVADCRRLPFKDGTFSLVYACHVIEHIDWYEVAATIKEWARVVAPGGCLEIHTVNAHRLMKDLVTLEETGEWVGPGIGTWNNKRTLGDPYLYNVGRLMNYPKGGNMHQIHRALITPKYLERCMAEAGLADLQPLGRDDMRMARHNSYINLGRRGVKC